MQLDLNKSAETLVLNLQKVGISNPPIVDVVFDLDVSGSFDDEHRDGTTNNLLCRLVPWGMVFDPDKKMEVFTFSHSEANAHYVGEVSPSTCDRYVQKNIINKVPGYEGGTDYGYVIEKNLKHLGWMPQEEGKKGLLSSLFKKKSPEATQHKKRSIVIIVTDGDNDRSDKPRTMELLRRSEERGDGVYFIFLGVSNQNARFPFIDELGEKFGNVGFVPISNVKSWVQQSDDQINSALLNPELIEWLRS